MKRYERDKEASAFLQAYWVCQCRSYRFYSCRLFLLPLFFISSDGLKNAVAEVVRVLKPGGRFFFEEVTKQALDRLFYRAFLKHPKDNRFTGEEFVAELERQGITVANNIRYWFFNDFIVGVGQRI